MSFAKALIEQCFRSDLFLAKDRFVVRWEAFNILNHPNFLISANFRNYNETAAGYLPDVQASGQGGPRVM